MGNGGRVLGNGGRMLGSRGRVLEKGPRALGNGGRMLGNGETSFSSTKGLRGWGGGVGWRRFESFNPNQLSDGVL